jgi:hypothetical protein
MWLNTNEFEEALASYWENEDQQNAIHWHRVHDLQSNRIFSARAKAGKLFKRIHDGMSRGVHSHATRQ